MSCYVAWRYEQVFQSHQRWEEFNHSNSLDRRFKDTYFGSAETEEAKRVNRAFFDHIQCQQTETACDAKTADNSRYDNCEQSAASSTSSGYSGGPRQHNFVAATPLVSCTIISTLRCFPRRTKGIRPDDTSRSKSNKSNPTSRTELSAKTNKPRPRNSNTRQLLSFSVSQSHSV